MRRKIKSVAHKLKGISLENVFPFTGRSVIKAALHQMRRRFEIFDQMILETKSADSPLAEAIRFTKSSGADVQKARIVNHITIGGIPNLLATCPPPSTSISPPRMREISPRIIKMVERKIPIHHSKRGLV